MLHATFNPKKLHTQIQNTQQADEIRFIRTSQAEPIAKFQQAIAALPMTGVGFRYVALGLSAAFHSSDLPMAVHYAAAMRTAQQRAKELNCPISDAELGLES
jgi:hypothetical protein